MSNGDPFSNHAANGLNPPFDYDPYSSENYYRPAQPILSANITSLDDPDDFYRPFAEQRSSQPDIVVQTDDGIMSNQSRPRRASAAGGASKIPSTASASNSPARTAQRSASGPAGPRMNTLASAKSMGALTASPGNRNGLIKERVKQLEKSRESSPATEGSNRYYRTRAASAQNTTAGAVRSPPRTRLSKERPIGSSPRARADKSNSRPLFGEVVDAGAGADGLGYGIASFSVDPDRMSGSMHQPNAMFSRSRSQSDLDVSGSSSPTFGHSRSQSHDAGPSMSNGSSSAASPTGDHKRNAPSSRIPVPRARRASDIGSTHSATRSRSRPAQTSHDQQAASSPMLLTSRRYSPPRRFLDPNHSVHAMVKPPPPKLSPPLRSTRNRQPVAAATATTAASRSRVTERFKPVSNSTASRQKPAIPVVDVAERRARLQKSLQGQTPHQRPVRQDLKNLQDGKYQSHRTNWVEADAASDVRSDASSDLGSRKSSTTISVPLLSIETSDVMGDAAQDLHSAGTEFEESPILGHNGQHELSPVQIPQPLSQDPDATAGAQQNRRDSQSLLKHVLSMRQHSPSEAPARTEVPDDYLTQIDDGETIQILLGATPKLPAQNWSPEVDHSASSPEAFHTPREEGGSVFDDDGFDNFDGRSSIVPDDSVSMIFQRKYADLLAREPVPPMPANAAEIVRSHNGYTLNTDARSEINRVLDQYQEGQVTPEMAHGFQQQVESLTPNLLRHNAWESPEATKQYLRSILEEPSITESPVDMHNDSKGKTIAKEPAPPVEESEVGGGIAIIYRNSAKQDLGEPLERTGTLHSHSTSNATLRPTKDDLDTDEKHRSYLEEIAFRPAPPPKDFATHGENDLARITTVPTLPEFSSSTSGLGLSMTHPEASTGPPSPHPPIPIYAPPAPPTPQKDIISPGFMPSHAPVSPVSERRVPHEMFTGGLPASPAATRKVQPTAMTEAMQQDVPRSAGPSIDISSTASRSHSPFSISRNTTADRSSQSLVTPDIEKELTQRRHRVKELVDTEHTFHQDLTIMTDIYLATAADVLSEEDRRLIFGNIEQLRNFTTEFLDALKRASAPIYIIPRENRWNFKRGSFTTSNSETTENSSSTNSANIEERLQNDRSTDIGQTFCDHLPKLQKVYSEWLRNASASNKRLAELHKSPAVKYWLDECIESHKDLTSAWNLDSLIVKPFQRSAKYTLLLDEILKFTKDDHPDYLPLKQAKDLVKAYNERANDVQKRTELVEQAMSKNKDSKKKFFTGKTTEKLKAQVGLSGLADDPEYDAIAQKFGGHFFQLQVVMRDIEKYLEDVHHYVDQYVSFMDALTSNASVDALTRYPEAESRWVNFSKAIMEMKTYALSEHTTKVRKSVIDPIQQLWRLHVGPQKMMAKRKKRAAEYVKHKAMIEKGEKPDKKLEQDSEQFRAVNETLKEELPKLYALTKKLVDNCLLNFVDLQAQWQNVWTRKLGPLIDDVELLQSETLPQALFIIQAAYAQDISDTDDMLATFKLCNKALVMEARNLKSPATTYSRDDESSYKRPSTLGSNGKRAMSVNDAANHSTPNFRLSNDNMQLSPLVGALGMPEGIYQPQRNRAGSAMSSRGPSTPYSAHTYAGPHYGANRPTTSDHGEPSPGVPRLSLDSPSTRSPARNDFGNPYVIPDARLPGATPGAYPPDERYSGMFHSALPMSDSPRAPSPDPGSYDLQVLFLAASLFEFNIDSTRKEGGYPYLTYQPGEVSLAQVSCS